MGHVAMCGGQSTKQYFHQRHGCRCPCLSQSKDDMPGAQLLRSLRGMGCPLLSFLGWDWACVGLLGQGIGAMPGPPFSEMEREGQGPGERRPYDPWDSTTWADYVQPAGAAGRTPQPFSPSPGASAGPSPQPFTPPAGASGVSGQQAFSRPAPPPAYWPQGSHSAESSGQPFPPTRGRQVTMEFLVVLSRLAGQCQARRPEGQVLPSPEGLRNLRLARMS